MGMTSRSIGALFAVLTLLTALRCDTPSSASAPTPESLLRGALEYLEGLSSAKVDADVSMQVKAMGQNQTINSTASVRFQRPDKFALVADGGMLGLTFITDGKQVVQYLPMLNRYTISQVGDGASASGLPGGANLAEFAKSFDADKAYDQIMKAVTGSRYVGRENIDGTDCHRCRYDSDAASFDVWYEDGERPLVRKIVPDLTKVLSAQAAKNESTKDMQIQWVVMLKDWDTDAKLSDADFAFSPPSGAEKVDTLFARGARRSREGPHPLLGQPAPPFEVVDLEGKPVSLAHNLGKNIIVLDFWATWCGPCVAALPTINDVTNSLKEQGVVFYAVNIGEEKQAVVDFLDEQKLKLPVALDLRSTVAASYRVSGIPQTVLIGKDGKVQVVHVGFGGNMKKQLTAELEQLLEGKDLASAAMAEADEAQARQAERLAEANSSPELNLAWTHEGAWNGVAADPKSDLAYASSASGTVVALDASGEKKSERTLQHAGSILRLAHLAGDSQPEFLMFGVWSGSLVADANDGTLLWEYPQGDGIDDVWAADLDQDGSDEVIVGYNGGTGLHVLKSDGAPIWKNTTLGNVWHVCAGDLDGDGRNEVITTSAQGVLHVFAADGEHLKDLPVPLYANMVRTAAIDGAGKPALALASGSGDAGEVLVGVGFDGKLRWETPLPLVDVPSEDSMIVAASQPLAAVAMRGGLVHVIDLATGKIVGHAVNQGEGPEVAWLERVDKPPLLLVASGAAVNAFEIEPASAE